MIAEQKSVTREGNIQKLRWKVSGFDQFNFHAGKGDRLFFPETKVNIRCRCRVTCFPDRSSCYAWPTEVYTDICPQSPLHSSNVTLVDDSVPHSSEEFREIRTSILGPSPELSQRVNLHTNTVQHNILCGVGIKLLCEVRVDAQEIG